MHRDPPPGTTGDDVSNGPQSVDGLKRSVANLSPEGKQSVVTTVLRDLSPEATQDVAAEAVRSLPPEAKQSIAAEAVRSLPDGATQDIAAEAVRSLPADAKKDVAAEAVRSLPPEAKQDVAAEAVRSLPPEAKKEAAITAAQTLSPEDKEDIIGRLQGPTQRTADRIWQLIVGTFALVFVLGSVALFVAVFLNLTQVQMLLTVFTTVAGILTGFISGRASSGRSST